MLERLLGKRDIDQLNITQFACQTLDLLVLPLERSVPSVHSPYTNGQENDARDN
ncbi:hypothetical protein ABTX24_00850 [Nocardioides sp. NPDC127514]|uniref:hypothetical protein n=1 Tax=unclassified Nocardioides TaxID=2615069 RepID=UPI003333C627